MVLPVGLLARRAAVGDGLAPRALGERLVDLVPAPGLAAVGAGRAALNRPNHRCGVRGDVEDVVGRAVRGTRDSPFALSSLSVVSLLSPLSHSSPSPSLNHFSHFCIVSFEG